MRRPSWREAAELALAMAPLPRPPTSFRQAQACGRIRLPPSLRLLPRIYGAYGAMAGDAGQLCARLPGPRGRFYRNCDLCGFVARDGVRMMGWDGSGYCMERTTGRRGRATQCVPVRAPRL